MAVGTAGGKRRIGLPFLLLCAGALVSCMLLVAWRRLDDRAAQEPGPHMRPGLYEPQVFYDREGGGGLSSSVAADAVGPPRKTLVIYVYHERCALLTLIR